MNKSPEKLENNAGQIIYCGRRFDMGELFFPSAKVVAAKLAFPEDWVGATARMNDFIKFCGYKTFPGGYGLVERIEGGYDPENETTLEMTAALIARRGDFLLRRGVQSESTRYQMMKTAVDMEVDRKRRQLKESPQDSYYAAELDGIMVIQRGLRSLVRRTA